MDKDTTAGTREQLLIENEALNLRLSEVCAALKAMRRNEANAIQGTEARPAGSAHHVVDEEPDEILLTLSAEGMILDCSKRFAHLLGYSRDQMTGLPFHRFTDEAMSPEVLYMEMVAKRFLDINLVPHNQDKTIPLRLTTKLLPGVNPEGKLLVFETGLPGNKQIEDELLQTQHAWENRVAERTSKLARANEELVASRIATLSIMEDAVEARKSLETTNRKLLEEISERRNAELQLEEANEQLRALTARIVSVREEERTSLSREIHDELGSSLTGLKMDLILIKRNIHENPDPQTIDYIMENITSMSGLIDSMIVTIRKIVTELRPEILDELGLIEAIRWYAGEFQKRTEVPVQVTVFPKSFTMNKKQTTELFRIFQEVLTNVSRHSGAGKVMVFLKKEKQQCTLRIKDNGIGIKEEDIARKNSFGLMGMRERTSLMNGKVKIVGKAGEGTTITIEIPTGSDI